MLEELILWLCAWFGVILLDLFIKENNSRNEK
jgi:hypothetical protein